MLVAVTASRGLLLTAAGGGKSLEPTYLVRYGWEAEDDDGNRSLVVHYELPQSGVVVANGLLDFPHRLVYLLIAIAVILPRTIGTHGVDRRFSLHDLTDSFRADRSPALREDLAHFAGWEPYVSFMIHHALGYMFTGLDMSLYGSCTTSHRSR